MGVKTITTQGAVHDPRPRPVAMVSGWHARSFMGRLPAPARDRLMDLGVPRTFGTGDVVVRQGDPGGAVMPVLDGRLGVTGIAENGTHSLLGVRHRGDVVGVTAVVAGTPHPETVTTRRKSTVLSVPGQRFLEFLARHPDAALALTASIADQLCQANAYRIDSAAYPVEVRIARALLYEAARRAPDSDGGVTIDLSQAELAGLIGAREATVQKAVGRGRELKRLVQAVRGRVHIHDVAALRHLAELEPTNDPAP